MKKRILAALLSALLVAALATSCDSGTSTSSAAPAAGAAEEVDVPESQLVARAATRRALRSAARILFFMTCLSFLRKIKAESYELPRLPF